MPPLPIKTKWDKHPLDKLDGGNYINDPTGAIHKWQDAAASTVLAATRGAWLLTILEHIKHHVTKDGKNQLLITDKVESWSVDILDKYDTANIKNKGAILKLAMDIAEAPLHETAASWSDIEKDTVKIRDAYSALEEYLVEFNDQMRKATFDSMSTPYQLARANYSRYRPNPWEGVAVWKMMEGVTNNKQVRVDKLTDKLRKASLFKIRRAADVGGALGCIHGLIAELLK